MVTATIHQNINFRNTAVLFRMLSLLPYNVAMPYPNNQWLFMRQKTYSCANMFVYSRTAPSFMPNLTLTQTHNEQFLLFLQCFLLSQIIVPHFSIFSTSYFYLLLNWQSPKLAYEIKG